MEGFKKITRRDWRSRERAVGYELRKEQYGIIFRWKNTGHGRVNVSAPAISNSEFALPHELRNPMYDRDDATGRLKLTAEKQAEYLDSLSIVTIVEHLCEGPKKEMELSAKRLEWAQSASERAIERHAKMKKKLHAIRAAALLAGSDG